MIYFCFVELKGCTVPYMEPMPVETLEEARAYARGLIRDQPRALGGYIIVGDEHLNTLELQPDRLNI
ncbi:MAG: hypothetical protein ACK4NU_03135 [Brevundimonas sp.]